MFFIDHTQTPKTNIIYSNSKLFSLLHRSFLWCLGGSGIPYCGQTNMMPAHHNYHNQSVPEHMGAGDGKKALKLPYN